MHEHPRQPIASALQAELFVLWTDDNATIHSLGSDVVLPYYLRLAVGDDPHEAVKTFIEGLATETKLMHSTSWRHKEDALVLTFIAITDGAPGGSESIQIERVTIARGDADGSPDGVRITEVLEHAIRHLAWLASDDDEIRASLPAVWTLALGGYKPEVFRAFEP